MATSNGQATTASKQHAAVNASHFWSEKQCRLAVLGMHEFNCQQAIIM